MITYYVYFHFTTSVSLHVGIPVESVLFRPSVSPLAPIKQLDKEILNTICGKKVKLYL
jgi:hypothetical protein